MRSLISLPLSLILTLCLVLPALAQDGDSRTVQDTRPLDPNGTVSIDNYKGGITVSTWDRDDVQIEARIEPDGDASLVDRTEVLIDGSGSSVRIETKYDDDVKDSWSGIFGGRERKPFVYYTVRIPASANLSIDDYKSAIELSNIGGDLEMDTYKGTIDISGVSGDFELETYKGDGTMRNVSGNLELDTYKGNLTVENLAGGLELDTYKGEVRVAFTQFTEDVAVDTYKGNVELMLPASAGFDLDTDFSDRADLDADFDLAAYRRGDNDYSGDVNGGGPQIRLESYKGRFALLTGSSQ